MCKRDYPAPPVQSVYINTQNKLSFKYGRIHIRAKTPTGDWLWPAFRLMPQRSIYGSWPRSGEIDIMQSMGNENFYRDNVNIGTFQSNGSLHFGLEPWNRASATIVKHSNIGLDKDFHLYQIEWFPTYISFSIDNQWFGSVFTGDGYYRRGDFEGNNPWTNGNDDAPFDEEFYFVINLAVGGVDGFFPDEGNKEGKPWRNTALFPVRDFWNGRSQWLPTWSFSNDAYNSSLVIDYIHVFAV